MSRDDSCSIDRRPSLEAPRLREDLGSLESRRDRLLELIRSYHSCLVAFSGGVDSCLVAKAAVLALGNRAWAVTGVSPSVPPHELDNARQVAALIGIQHECVDTSEFENPAYLRNLADRCYHCKTELYSQLGRVLERVGAAVVLNGANADDLDDYRPGMQAAREHSVRAPLAECGFTKADVRELARHWDLPVWDKPASPCLSSRVAYGEAVTPERLAMIDRAEQWLRGLGLREVRVRYHGNDLARVEVPSEAIALLASPEVRARLVAGFRSLGFKFVTLDLEGFRSGSFHTLVPESVLVSGSSLLRRPG